MYRPFFGLRDRPFDLTPNPRFLVLTDAHREALSNLEYGVASRRGITLLLGEAGTGKTTIIRTALERQPDRVHSVHLHNPSLRRDEFVEMLAVRFGLSNAARTSKTALLVELEALMRERHRRGESTVLIIDEAQSLPLDLLEEVRLLANIETDDTKLLSVVLAGQPELARRLNDDALRQLKQRIALRCELGPLSLTETLGYVAGRIAAAGGVGAQIFTREAVMLIHERSRGIPRTISVIADNALLTGFALGRRPVTRAMVEEVCRDLDLRGPAGTNAPPIDARVSTAARPPAPVSEPAKSDSALIAFEPPAAGPRVPPPPSGPDEATTGESGQESREPKQAVGGNSESGLFRNMYPKRMPFRFFTFTRQG
jgi:general secretion pathway protein A